MASVGINDYSPVSLPNSFNTSDTKYFDDNTQSNTTNNNDRFIPRKPNNPPQRKSFFRRFFDRVINFFKGLFGIEEEPDNQIRSNDNILSLNNSGNDKYPEKHSVFTNNVQERLSYSNNPCDENFRAHLNGITDYRNVRYGSDYIKELCHQITQGRGKQTLDSALISTTKTFNGNPSSEHKPLFRLGSENYDNPNRDFEVLCITGSGTGLGDDRRFRFDSAMLEGAVKNSYGEKCKNFQSLNDPNRAQLESAIRERSESARKNGRKLYIVYRGHGELGQTQSGARNSYKQGSANYIFKLNKAGYFSEAEYKALLTQYADDLDVTSVIGSCHSGAAITAIEKDVEKRMVTLPS